MFCRSPGLILASVLVLMLPVASSAQAPGGRPGGPQGAAPRTVAVVLGKAVKKPMPVRFDTIGSVQTVASVTLRPRVESQITEIAFKDGAAVKKDDVLVRLDARGIEAQIRQAEANLIRSQAQLEQAQRDVRRFEQLLANESGSRVNYDNARTQVTAIGAQIKSEEAALDNLRVSLSHYTIRAPISGRVGVAGLKEGNIAKTGDGSPPLAVINQIAPIYVSFSVPQRFLADLRAAISDPTAKVEVVPQGGGKAVEGRIAVIDNQVDAASGTIGVRAEVANAEEVLWPGQLCNVRVVFRTEPEAVAVPREAVQTGQRGTFVFVVSENVARVRPVTVARSVDGLAVIADGLKGDETVVVDGQLLVTDGVRVEQRGGGGGGGGGGAPGGPGAAGEPRKGAS
jgi:multidrug efflux system membrane fusion protein